MNITSDATRLARVVILALIGSLGFTANSSAQAPFTSGILNIDFYYYTIYPGYGPGAGAIGNSGDIWNQVLWPTYNGDIVSGLQNNSGTVTTVAMSFENESGGGGSFGGTYGPLFGLYESFSTSTQIDQLTGLTASTQYDLYLFDPLGSTIAVNGVDFLSAVPTRPAFSLVAGTGYSEDVVTTDSFGDLNISAPSGSGEFSALELTPFVVPEPATWATLLCGFGYSLPGVFALGRFSLMGFAGTREGVGPLGGKFSPLFIGFPAWRFGVAKQK